MRQHMDRFRRLQAEQSSQSRSKSFERFLVNRLLTVRALACLSIFFLWLWTATILWFTITHQPTPTSLRQHNPNPNRDPKLPSAALLPFKSFETREKEWKARTEELQSRRDRGETLNDEDAFNLQFAHLALTKSLLVGGHEPGHCEFSGPRPRKISVRAKEALLEEVAPKIGVTKEELGGYLEQRNGQLLSVKHEFCTSEHAEVYEGAMLEEELFASRKTPAAYLFRDVCTTFNLDSVKRAQRAVVVFDNTNDHPQRCSPCPNPQMNKVWGGNECGIMWLHQMNVKSFEDFNECYHANRKLIRAHGQRQEPGETPVKAAMFYSGTTLLVQFVQINPGHQLWDFLFSLFPLLINQGFQAPYFDHVVVQQAPDCSDAIWSCRILRRLGVFTAKTSLGTTSTEENLVKNFNGVLPCFERLVAPVPGWNHLNSRYRPKALQLVRSKLQEAFELKRFAKEVRTHANLKELYKRMINGDGADLKLLLYPHSTKGEAGKVYVLHVCIQYRYLLRKMARKFVALCAITL